MDYEKLKNCFFIDGEFKKSSSSEFFKVINPATEEIMAQIPICTEEDVLAAIDSAETAFENWSAKPVSERSLILLKVAEIVENNKEEFSLLESQNVGKPLEYAKEDVEVFIDNMRFFAGAGRSLSGLGAGEYVKDHTSFTRREPLGVISAITPWNAPLMMAGWKIGPALITGNTVVLKPSEYTPLTTLLLAELTKEIIPPGVINIVTGAGDNVGKLLTNNEKVKMISLTGSVKAGQSVAEQSIETMKKTHLELGGNAPVVIFEDANIIEAVKSIRVAAFCNSGQDCTAATRIYVSGEIYDEFLKNLVNEISKIKVGNPLEKETEVGPLVSRQQLDRVASFVNRVKSSPHADILIGGDILVGSGYYYQPTVITGVKQDDEIVQEEVFGPVVTVIPFSSEEEAYALANDSKYALSSSVWTTNLSRALTATKKIQAGTVWVNTHMVITSEMPHGGAKLSGHGNEQSIHSLEEYTQIKHVMFNNAE
ncbi:aminobutyraldehyde dehydrogenase [Salinicoccus sp. Marseille-QA3877]